MKLCPNPAKWFCDNAPNEVGFMPELSRLKQGLCGIAAGFVLGSCGNTVAAPERPEVKPQDFALVPCGPGLAERPCALVVAGGKRVLFGAPAGVAATLTQEDLSGLDAVMLFSLRAADIEGLDEIRNETWWAGRDEPLLVVGPEGTGDMVEALNKAFEQADALRIVEEGIPPGGYDAAVLEARESLSGVPDFDTGDLVIHSINAGAWEAIYAAEELVAVAIEVCGLSKFEWPDGERPNSKLGYLGCEDVFEYPWPLTETVFIVKN